MSLDQAIISDIVKMFLRTRDSEETFEVLRPPNEDVYLVRFEDQTLPDIEIQLPLASDLRLTLPPRLEIAFLRLDR